MSIKIDNEHSYATINVQPKDIRGITIIPTQIGTQELFNSLNDNEFLDANLDQIGQMINDLSMKKNNENNDYLVAPELLTATTTEPNNQPNNNNGKIVEIQDLSMPFFDKWWNQILGHLQIYQYQLFLESTYRVLKNTLEKTLQVDNDDHKIKIMDQLVWLNKSDQSALKSSYNTLKNELKKYNPLPSQFEDELMIYDENIKTTKERAKILMISFEQDIQQLLAMSEQAKSKNNFNQAPAGTKPDLMSYHYNNSIINTSGNNSSSSSYHTGKHYETLVAIIRILVQCFSHIESCRDRFYNIHEEYVKSCREKNKNVLSSAIIIQSFLKKQIKTEIIEISRDYNTMATQIKTQFEKSSEQNLEKGSQLFDQWNLTVESFKNFLEEHGISKEDCPIFNALLILVHSRTLPNHRKITTATPTGFLDKELAAPEKKTISKKDIELLAYCIDKIETVYNKNGILDDVLVKNAKKITAEKEAELEKVETHIAFQKQKEIEILAKSLPTLEKLQKISNNDDDEDNKNTDSSSSKHESGGKTLAVAEIEEKLALVKKTKSMLEIEKNNLLETIAQNKQWAEKMNQNTKEGYQKFRNIIQQLKIACENWSAQHEILKTKELKYEIVLDEEVIGIARSLYDNSQSIYENCSSLLDPTMLLKELTKNFHQQQDMIDSEKKAAEMYIQNIQKQLESLFATWPDQLSLNHPLYRHKGTRQYYLEKVQEVNTCQQRLDDFYYYKINTDQFIKSQSAAVDLWNELFALRESDL